MSVVLPNLEVTTVVRGECGGVCRRRRSENNFNGFWRNNGTTTTAALDDDQEKEQTDCSECSSSSIGDPSVSVSSSGSEEHGTDSGGGDDGEAESKPSKEISFGSLASLEESLPIKRGLSNYFSGKSKSFACFKDVANNCSSSAADLVKHENPFNKRRRILTAAKNSWRSSSYASLNNSNASLLPSLVDNDHEDEDETFNNNYNSSSSSSSNDQDEILFPLVPFSNNKNRRKLSLLKNSNRSFSLSDLHSA